MRRRIAVDRRIPTPALHLVGPDPHLSLMQRVNALVVGRVEQAVPILALEVDLVGLLVGFQSLQALRADQGHEIGRMAQDPGDSDRVARRRISVRNLGYFPDQARAALRVFIPPAAFECSLAFGPDRPAGSKSSACAHGGRCSFVGLLASGRQAVKVVRGRSRFLAA
jgi:hypothetical protein